MTLNKNNDEILELSQKNIRQDMLLFKEEVLKDIKNVQKVFSVKFAKMEDLLKEQINLYESKVNSFDQRIKNLSNLISSDRTMIEKVEELTQFKDETKDKLITDSIRLTNIETDFKVNIKNIEHILSNSVIYPGLIGFSGKFKSFHDYMDYILNSINELNLFKEKNIHDLIPYKKKIDEALDNVKLQLSHIINTTNEFTIKKINDSEQRIKSMIQLYDDRLQDTRVENAHYAIGLEKKAEDLSKLIKNIYEVKADIYKKLKDEIANVKGDQRYVVKLFSGYKKEFNQIKNKFIELSEFIRDVRFRVNIAPDIKKKEFIDISKKLNFNYKDNISYSGNKRKSLINRTDTFDFKKKFLNKNNDIFESPFNNTQTKNYPNTFELVKRNSMQINTFSKFPNTAIKNFDSVALKEEAKGKNLSDASNKLKLINNNFEKHGLDLNDRSEKKNLNRRNTVAISISKNFNKDFSDFNDKDIKIKSMLSNNEIMKNKKEKDENSLYSSISSDEDKSKSNINNVKEKNNRKESYDKEKSKEKNQYIIKEEDENNISEISEDNKKKKSIKENKNGKEKENKNENKKENKEENKKENREESKVENKVENKGGIKDENKEENKDENIIKDLKNISNNTIKNNEKIQKIEKQNDMEESDVNNEKKIDTINKYDNNLNNKKNQYNKIFSAKNGSKSEKIIKLQINKIDPKEKVNKPERNNTISIININDMFMNQNKANKHTQFINSSRNFLYALSIENNYLKQNQMASNWYPLKNKSNPSLISKPKKLRINSNSFKNLDRIVTSNNIVNSKIEENIDNENINNFEKIYQPYKTFSNFPKIGLDKSEGKTNYINSKIVLLNNNSKKKKINDVANNFLNKKINKTTLNKGPDIYKKINLP